MSEQIQWFLKHAGEHLFASFLSWNDFADALAKLPKLLTDLKGGLAWPYLVSSMAVAWLLYWMVKRTHQAPGLSFSEFVFPPSIYRHSSSRLDRRFAAVDLLLTVLFYLPITTAIALLGTKVMTYVIIDWWSWEPPKSLSPVAAVGAGFVFLLLHDFITFWAHLCFHRVPWLWSFHKVHHSAEVLTPVTTYRVHPFENISVALLHAPAVGLAMVFYRDIVGSDIQFTLICGVNAVSFLLMLAGSHLRHSHLWFSFGPILNKVVMSPAHHVIHHSIEPQHLDKNFGVKFPIWDWLFGTLYEPKQRERFSVGVREPGFVQFSSARALYIRPFKDSVIAMIHASRRRRPEMPVGAVSNEMQQSAS